MEGWIKIDRNILEWGWYTDKNTFKLFLHMLLKANWKDGEFLGVKIKRGSFATSLTTLVAQTGLTESEVRTAIKHLEQTGEVTGKRHPKFTVFTVKNYSRYQVIDRDLSDESQGIDRDLTEVSHRLDMDLSTIEERKKYKKEKKEKREEGKNNPPISPQPETPYFEDEELDRAFVNYMDYCRRRGAPVNDVDAEIIKRRLCVLAMGNDGVDIEKAIGIIEQTIANRWSGLFPLDKDKKKIAQKKTDDEEWNEILERRKNDEQGHY